MLTQPLISPLNQSLQRLCEAPQANAATQPPISFSFLAKTGSLALLSAVVYFTAAIPAGQRYSDYATIYAGAESSETDWFFIWTTAVCAGLTMTAFDWEVYFHKWRDEISWSGYFAACAKELYKKPLHVIFALACGISNILPLWYVSLRENIFWNMFVTSSTLAASIIFYDGVQVCYEVANYPEVQLFMLHGRLSLSCMTGESPEVLAEKIEWAQIKKIIWKALEEKYDAFFYANDQHRLTFVHSTQNQELQHYINGTHLSALDRSQNQWLIFLIGYVFLKWLLRIAGCVQNLGFTVETYIAGKEWGGLFLGITLAILGTIPGIGFTIKGILGKGILDALSDATHGRTSQMHRLLPGYIRAVGVVMYVVCALSGFDGDTLSYLSAKFLGSDEATAIILGVVTNIGCAFVFNLPQYMLLKTWLEESLVLLDQKHAAFHSQIRLQGAFRGFCGELRKASVEDAQEFVTEHYAGMSTLFEAKDFSVLRVIKMPTTA